MCTDSTTHPPTHPPTRCDFVFYRGQREKSRILNRRCRLEMPFLNSTWLSDHFGILVEMSMHPLTADP